MTRKNISTLLIASVLFTVRLSFAQQGKHFPSLEATSLAGKTVKIPEETNGKHSVLCLVYSQKSEKNLEGWLIPMYSTFIEKNQLSVNQYDLHTYFIVMLSGIKEAAAGLVEKRLKKEIDPSLHPYILLYKGSMAPYLKELEFGKKDEPYFCVVNKEGKISYSTTGVYTEEKMEEIESKVQD